MSAVRGSVEHTVGDVKAEPGIHRCFIIPTSLFLLLSPQGQYERRELFFHSSFLSGLSYFFEIAEVRKAGL